jgi:ornithine--oxo-acid transaminase
LFENNFHGRTTTIISFSNDENARKNFGPLQKALSNYDDTDALEAALKSNVNIAGFLVEPIQVKRVYVPTEGYL